MATKRTLGEVMQSLSTQPDPKTTFILQIAAQIAENKKNRRGVLSSACLFFALRETQLEYSKLPMAKPSQVGSRGAPLDDFCDFIYTKDSKKYIQWKKNYFGDPEGDLDYKIKDKFELELGSNTPEILITASRLGGEIFSQDHFSPEHLIASLIFNRKAKVNQGTINQNLEIPIQELRDEFKKIIYAFQPKHKQIWSALFKAKLKIENLDIEAMENNAVEDSLSSEHTESVLGENNPSKEPESVKYPTHTPLGQLLNKNPIPPSEEILTILNNACSIAKGKRNYAGELTTTCVFIGLIETQAIRKKEGPSTEEETYKTTGLQALYQAVHNDFADPYKFFRNEYSPNRMLSSAKGRLDEGKNVELSGNMREVIQRASELAEKSFSPDSLIQPDHLIASLFSHQDAKFKDNLKEYKISFKQIKENFVKIIGEHFPDKAKEWRKILELPIILNLAAPTLSQYNKDGDTDGDTIEDSLNFDAQAETFARLFTAHEVRPPLSLGLFGNWGSGKSYFMDLLIKQVRSVSKGEGGPKFSSVQLANGSGEDVSEEKVRSKFSYVQRVVQIKFNAWHYMDSNLWASLAVHIFNMLALEIAKDQNPEIDEPELKKKSKKLRDKILEQSHAYTLARRRKSLP